MDKDEFYSKYYKLIKEAYYKAKNWDDVFALNTLIPYSGDGFNELLDYTKEVHGGPENWGDVLDENGSVSYVEAFCEALVNFVEEVTKTKVKDAKHFKELVKGSTLADKVNFDNTLILANYSKFDNALMDALDNGAKYKDLLKINLQDYNLPERWGVGFAYDQYTAIIYAIGKYFSINIPKFMVSVLGLRYIANEIDAPYSVVMDAYKFTKSNK